MPHDFLEKLGIPVENWHCGHLSAEGRAPLQAWAPSIEARIDFSTEALFMHVGHPELSERVSFHLPGFARPAPAALH